MQEKHFDNYDGAKPMSQRGDIYILGRHRLMCGDSTDQADVTTLMAGEYADMLLTDPPYNVGYEGKTQDRLKLKNDAMNNADFCAFLTRAFSAADRAMKPGAVFYIWYASINSLAFLTACENVGWKVRQCLIWAKNAFVFGRQDYQWKHEPCLYGWKSGAAHLWTNDRKQTTVLNYARPTKNTIHPTMKPLELFDYMIRNNTREGEIVLDLFGGSGTTIIAAEKNGRTARVMELDERYVDAIVRRYIGTVGDGSNVILRREGEDYLIVA